MQTLRAGEVRLWEAFHGPFAFSRSRPQHRELLPDTRAEKCAARPKAVLPAAVSVARTTAILGGINFPF